MATISFYFDTITGSTESELNYDVLCIKDEVFDVIKFHGASFVTNSAKHASISDLVTHPPNITYLPSTASLTL